MRSVGVFVDLHLNKRLSKQSISQWFETPSLSLWRHCNVSHHLHVYIFDFLILRLSYIFCPQQGHWHIWSWGINHNSTDTSGAVSLTSTPPFLWRRQTVADISPAGLFLRIQWSQQTWVFSRIRLCFCSGSLRKWLHNVALKKKLNTNRENDLSENHAFNC